MDVKNSPNRTETALTAPGAMFEVRQEDVRGVPMPVFRHRMRSLREILESGRRFGDRTYLVDGDLRLSFAEHLRAVDGVAAALRAEYGVRAGDRVAIFAANRWDWVVCFWAIASLGAVPCAMNGWWTAAEFQHATRLVEPVLVIGDRPRLDRLDPATIDVPRLCLDDDLPRLLTAHQGEVAPAAPVAEDEVALLLFTSGTTGAPKAVAIPHRSVAGFAQVSLLLATAERVANGMPVPAAGALLPATADVTLVTAPLFHVSMLQGAVVMSIVRGATIVLLPGRFDPERVLRTIQAEGVTSWSPLGSAGPRVAGCATLGDYDTSSVRHLGIGGAPVGPAVQRALRAAFPSARSVAMGYTSTEGGAVIARIGGAEYLAHPTSTGRISPTTEVELRDAHGRAVPEGDYGEVHVRSPYLMLGYWRDPEASAQVLKADGWLALGDVGRFADGLLYLDARARDLILVNAENVSPTEVEYVLDEHPDVDEAAVFAVDDAVTGDAVCAVVLPRPGRAPDTARLAEWCGARLAHYKVPTRWYLTAEPLPRTPSGKLLKRALRDWIDTIPRA